MWIKQGDTRPVLQADISAQSDDVIATVRFFMRRAGIVKVSADGIVISQPTLTTGGTVRYEWVAGDTDTAGVFQGEFQVTFSDNRIETYPNDSYLEINITDDISS